MKKICLLVTLFVSLLAVKSNAQDKFAAWPALAEFHTVMSATFHPAEEGDFDPVKQRSGELVDKAASLGKSVVPAQFDKPAIRTALKQLKTKTAALNKIVLKKAKNEKINTALVSVHDTFHEIVGLCTEDKDSH
ncbi:hypothetical protein GCM10011387_19090 [Pedobacter quisquiliarum]|uniref:Uncharacterized protein n=1 Tax=Pedobacter quisquiliarum TaxID=1834438 RepID=A0A916UC65_9SPHI|nr:hypothetical protein [Pedobacter quisquiliarum]GGC65680.1 hypothetical protein GCM10011387_19090 [Pedobacter quisquiliarum]